MFPCPTLRTRDLSGHISRATALHRVTSSDRLGESAGGNPTTTAPAAIKARSLTSIGKVLGLLVPPRYRGWYFIPDLATSFPPATENSFRSDSLLTKS